MAFLKRYGILATVFVTGAVVLVTEIAATRILAPYFGATTYSVSSVIGVILAALSCGYYFGGRFADRHPEARWFYAIIAAGGLALLFLRAAMGWLLPAFAYSWSYVEGPLAWSLFLFFAPCFLLGCLSPFAVALQQRRFPEKGAGSVSGEVFFWSTAGSIAGSLLAGFALIPHFSLSSVIASTAALLLAIGCAGLILAKRRAGKEISTIAMLAIASYVAGMGIEPNQPVYAKEGTYQHIAVQEGRREGRPARFLQQDGMVSGGMFLDSDAHVFPYTEYYAVHRLFRPEVRDALVIGGGAFVVPNAMVKTLPEAHVDVVEIEPALVEIGRRFFELPDDPRLTVHVDDGRRFLHADGRPYDVIFSDVYQSLIFVPPHLATTEFFEAGKRRLRSGGVFVANLIGDPNETGPSFLLSQMRTFKDVFPDSYFFNVQAAKPGALRNVIFVGVKDGKGFDLAAARQHADPFIRDLTDHLIDIGSIDLSAHAAFTDDFSPAEALANRAFLQPNRRPRPFQAE